MPRIHAAPVQLLALYATRACTICLAALVEELQLYREAGLSSVSLRLYEQPAESMKLIAEQVLPKLR